MFRTVTDCGWPSKTYVYYGREHHTIAVKRYFLGTEAGGWEPVKKFKDKCLYKETTHFHVASFQKIECIVSQFLAWNTKINQQK